MQIFPDNFIDKHHPDDFKLSHEFIKEFYFHKLPHHNRLILRISIEVSSNIYIPFIFVCDTGAPSHIYINSITRRLIKNRIIKDDLDNQIITLSTCKKFAIYYSLANNSDVNIIGLLSLAYFGLIVQEDHFEFLNLPDYL
jgi:hypothetical protein